MYYNPTIMVNTTAIKITGLSKYYGKSRGIVDLNLEVSQGEILGYLGPNGAGKTTTMRILMDFIRASEGTAQIFGMDSHKDSLNIRRNIGYLSTSPVLYENLTGRQFLTYCMNIKGQDGLRFYEFDFIKDEKAFKQRYSETLNSLPIDQHMADSIVEEANYAFKCNMEMFKELEGNLIAAIGKLLFSFLTKRKRKGSTET